MSSRTISLSVSMVAVSPRFFNSDHVHICECVIPPFHRYVKTTMHVVARSLSDIASPRCDNYLWHEFNFTPLTRVDPSLALVPQEGKQGKYSKSGCNETPTNITYVNKRPMPVFAYCGCEYDQFYMSFFYSTVISFINMFIAFVQNEKYESSVISKQY